MRILLACGWSLLLLCSTPGQEGPRAPTPKAGTRPDDQRHVVDVDGVTIELVRVGKGTFWMGSPPDEPGRTELGEGQRDVSIPYDFFLGKYEVTQEQWEAVMG